MIQKGYHFPSINLHVVIFTAMSHHILCCFDLSQLFAIMPRLGLFFEFLQLPPLLQDLSIQQTETNGGDEIHEAIQIIYINFRLLDVWHFVRSHEALPPPSLFPR